MGLKVIKRQKRWIVFVDEANTIPTGFEIRRLNTEEQLFGILKAGTRFLVGLRKRRIDAYHRALKLYKEKGESNETDNINTHVADKSDSCASGMDNG